MGLYRFGVWNILPPKQTACDSGFRGGKKLICARGTSDESVAATRRTPSQRRSLIDGALCQCGALLQPPGRTSPSGWEMESEGRECPRLPPSLQPTAKSTGAAALSCRLVDERANSARYKIAAADDDDRRLTTTTFRVAVMSRGSVGASSYGMYHHQVHQQSFQVSRLEHARSVSPPSLAVTFIHILRPALDRGPRAAQRAP